MKNTVLYVGTFVMPDKNAAATRVIGIGTVLEKIGYRVVYQGNQYDPDEPEKPVKKNINGLSYYTRKKWNSIEYYSDASYIYDMINTIGIKNVSMIIMYHPPSIIALKVKRFCDLNGITLIMDVTEWYSIKAQFSQRNRVVRALDFWFRMYYVNRKVKNIIAISSFLESYYKKKGCRVAKIPIISTAMGRRDSISHDVDKRLVLCYCGSPTKKDKLFPIVKCVERMIDEGNDGIELKIVGTSHQEFQETNEYSIDSKYNSFIRFYGRLPHAEAVNILSQADFSLIIRPNQRYAIAGFPTKMVEAFSYGIPVIACSNGDIPQFVKNGINGYLVDPVNIESDLYQVLKVVNKLNEIVVNRMKEGAFNTAVTFFSPCRYENILMEFICNIKSENDAN